MYTISSFPNDKPNERSGLIKKKTFPNYNTAMRINYTNLQRLLKAVVSSLARRLNFGILQLILLVNMHFLIQDKQFYLWRTATKNAYFKLIFSVWLAAS